MDAMRPTAKEKKKPLPIMVMMAHTCFRLMHGVRKPWVLSGWHLQAVGGLKSFGADWIHMIDS
jgi:hypothetical protein